MKKSKMHIIISYSFYFILLGFIIFSNKGIILKNNKMILKNMDESTQESDFNKTIDGLNLSYTSYANYIQTSKINLAQAITNAGVETNDSDSFETMIANISSIMPNTTNDATATEEQILEGQTAYVNGNKVIGTMTNNGAVTPTELNAGESYTIPEGYHNGSGKVTATTLSGQTSGTATAAQILSGQTAYVNGNTVTGTMPNNGEVTPAELNAGGSYTIPAGYHNGSGKVKAAALSSQTSGTATVAEILSGKTAWVNGSRVTGTMVNRGNVNVSLREGGVYIIPAGYHSGSGTVRASSFPTVFTNVIHKLTSNASATNTNAQSYTVPSDGIIIYTCYHANSTGNSYATLNGVTINSATGPIRMISGCIKVKAGDVLYLYAYGVKDSTSNSSACISASFAAY